MTPVTVLPSQWADDGSLRLPAVISAPDFGQMLLAESGNRRLRARLEGSRSKTTVDFYVELPALRLGKHVRFEFDSGAAARAARVDGPGSLGKSAAGLVRCPTAKRPVG